MSAAFGAHAQQASPPAPSQPAAYTLTVTPEELALIGQALGKLSYEQSAPLIGKLTQQMQQAMIEQRRKAALEAAKSPASAPKP